MTKEEYGEVRDMFARALGSLNEVFGEFVELAFEHGDPETDDDVPDVLNEKGSWLTAGEYYGVQDAVKLLERLVGRAHARSV